MASRTTSLELVRITLSTGKTTEALAAENEQLKATVGKLEERLKVLERIATDPSRQLADEIDKLR